MSISNFNELSSIEKELDGFNGNDVSAESSLLENIFSVSVSPGCPANEQSSSFSSERFSISDREESGPDILALAEQQLPRYALSKEVLSQLKGASKYCNPDDLIAQMVKQYHQGPFGHLMLGLFLYEINQSIEEVLKLPGSIEISDVIKMLRSLDVLVIQKMSQIIRSLPDHLSTLDNFKMLFDLIKSGEKIDEIDFASFLKGWMSLPESLRTPEISKILVQAGDSAPIVADAIKSLPQSLRTPEILEVLVQAERSAVIVADAIRLLPQSLRRADVFAKLLENTSEAVITALQLQEIDEPEQLEKKDSMDEHSILSQYIGSRPGPDGVGFIHEYKQKDEFNPSIARSQEERESILSAYNLAQQSLLPAPEGPQIGLELPKVSSAGMQRLAAFFLGEESSGGSSLLEDCKKVKERLEASGEDGRLEYFQRCFFSWIMQELGYSCKGDGTWAVPDVKALRHGLARFGISIHIGEVENIASDKEYLRAFIQGDFDVVIGQFAHDHWVHMVSQLQKYFNQQFPGKYAEELHKMRLVAKVLIDALGEFAKNMNPEDEKFYKFFITLISMSVDVFTARSEYSSFAGIREIFESGTFDSHLANLYPEDFKDRVKFWKEFVVFAKKLVRNYIKDESVKKLIQNVGFGVVVE